MLIRSAGRGPVRRRQNRRPGGAALACAFALVRPRGPNRRNAPNSPAPVRSGAGARVASETASWPRRRLRVRRGFERAEAPALVSAWRSARPQGCSCLDARRAGEFLKTPARGCDAVGYGMCGCLSSLAQCMQNEASQFSKVGFRFLNFLSGDRKVL